MNATHHMRFLVPVVSLAILVTTGPGLSSGYARSPSSRVASSSRLVFETFEPYSGPDAAFGPLIQAGCFPAARLMNQAGGIGGHQVACNSTDTKGDPADAVPAARRMIATTSNLVGIIGPSSDESTATIPVFQQAHVPFFTNAGQAIFRQDSSPYFYRIYPPDDSAGYAMAVWGHQKGYKRAAAVFGNDPSEQGTVPTFLKAFTKLGGKIVSNQSVALDHPSYRSEIERMLQAKPQVIFTEIDPQTAATFFSELQQLNGSLLPIIGADPTLLPTWFGPVAKAIGTSNLIKYHTAEQPATPASTGVAWHTYNGALRASSADIRNPAQYSSNYTPEVEYDSVNIMGLAMLAAKSTKPSVYNAYITRVTAPSRGAVVVRTFKAGKAALAHHKRIQYLGVTGPFLFNRYHNAPVRFEIDHFDKKGNLVTIGHVTAAEIAAIIK